MKKTLLVTTLLSSFAVNASDITGKQCTRDLIDPRDCKGWQQLDDLAEKGNNPDLINELYDAYENGNDEDYNGKTKKELHEEIYASISTMSTEHKLATFSALNNITVSQKYDSLLDQMINGGNAPQLANFVISTPSGSVSVKEAYNNFEQAKDNGLLDGVKNPFEKPSNDPVKWESPKDGSTAKKVKDLMGNVSRGDMSGYKALFAMADTREEKQAVLGMMIVNEANVNDIVKFLSNSERFVEEFGKEFFEFDEDGSVKKDYLGNPSLIPNDEGKTLDEIAKEKRSAQWTDKVKSFYNGIETKIDSLSEDDKLKALRVLDSISIQGQKSLLETLQANGHLKEIDPETIEPIENLEKVIIDKRREQIIDEHEIVGLNPIDVGKPVEECHLDGTCDVIVEPDPIFVDPITEEKVINDGQEFIDEINNIVKEENEAEADKVIKDFLTGGDGENKEGTRQAAAQDIVDQTEKDEALEVRLSSIVFEVPTAAGDEMETISLLDYISGVAEGDEDKKAPSMGEDEFDKEVQKQQYIDKLNARFDETDKNVAKNTNEIIDIKDSNTALVSGLKEHKQKSQHNITEAFKGVNKQLASGSSELINVITAMQAQLAQQAQMIKDLQSNGEVGVPENGGINADLQVGLEKAGSNLTAKMTQAKTDLTNGFDKVKKGLEKAGDGIRNGNPVGVNPPSNGNPNHEYGSVGQGAAHSWAHAGIQEVYNTGNDYTDAKAEETLTEAKAYTDQRIDEIKDDLDHTIATAQAITAARPYIGYGHESAVGIGLGQAGDSSAISVGYAQKLNNNWTLNGNVSGTKGNDVNFSVGVGASYSW